MESQDIQPGTPPSYQTCKDIYMYHPLGAKMAESPISMAQCQSREITIPDGPEERVRDRFAQQWREDNCDRHIFNVMKLARIYGIASVAVLVEGKDPASELKLEDLWRSSISYNVFDPLNTAGSLVLSQQPNAMNFLKTTDVVVQGQHYHRSRTCVMLNEEPIYIGYTSSAFGFVGRSVYQRSLYPLKSFINSMITDDMVTRKSGLLIAKIKQAGSIVNGLMQQFTAAKRALLREAKNDNVLSIDPTEDVESLDLHNIGDAFGMARKNILENIAVSADMPAKLLNSETFAEGFGEGSEDAKYVARYIDRLREQMNPLYLFFDRITQHRAWNPDFYETIQEEFPEYRRVTYERAFYQWQNCFSAVWPSLLTEPDSEKVRVDDVKLRGIISLLEVLMPELDPENKATAIEWAADNFNELSMLFQSPLEINRESLESYTPPQPGMQSEEGHEMRPETLADGEGAIRRLRSATRAADSALGRLGQEKKSLERVAGMIVAAQKNRGRREVRQ